MSTTAQINITRPMDRRLVHEFERHTKATRDYSLSADVSKKGYTIDEVREMGYNKLSKFYGVDVRTL